VQRELLDDDTLLLEYALGEERSYLWAITSKEHSSYELPARAMIERATQGVYERLTARTTAIGDQSDFAKRVTRADTEYWPMAADLSEMLLGPVAKKMAGRRIVVVTDGALQYLPFAALPVPRRRGEPVPLIVEHEVVSLPSASVLAVLRRETSDRKLPEGAVAVLADPVFEIGDPRLPGGGTQRIGTPVSSKGSSPEGYGGVSRALGAVVGFVQGGKVTVPRLPSTRREATAIVATAGQGTTFEATDFRASRATAMSPDLARYRILHFATHGLFNNDDPGLSGIVLSMFDERGGAQNGFLRLHDIYGLRLPAELVVLSACETALGKPVRGEGLVGMVRGFMHAGAKRVVASVWKVDDEATLELMTRFYDAMLAENRSPAAALRQAQLAMWQHNKWRPPFYWAAFVLEGEWK
jgi:CHAT domain-containing protein